MTKLMMLAFLLSFLFPGCAFAGKIEKDFPHSGSVERWGLIFIFSLLHVCAFSFGLACFGAFSVGTVWILLLLSGFLYLIWLRPTRSDFLKLFECKRSLTVAVALAAFGYYAFPQPSEWLTNYHMDAGRYSNAASFILHDGGYLLKNTFPPFSDVLEEADYNNFPGMFPTPNPGEHIVPYVHLFPALQAFYRGHVGVYHSFTLNWLLGISGALLFYTFVVLAFGSRLGGLLGVLLYFSNAATQLYFMRNYPETLSTVFFLALGVLFWCFEKRPSRLYAVFTAVLIALLCFCRLDMGVLYILVPGVIGVVMLFSSWKPPKYYLTFLLWNLLFLAPVVLYYHYQATSYVYLNTRQNIGSLFHALGYNYKSFRPEGHLYWFGLCAVILLFNIVVCRFGRKLFEVKCLSSEQTDRKLAWTLSAGFGMWLLYAATLRPYLASLSPETFHHDTINLPRLLYFVDPIIWILAAYSMYGALMRRDTRFFTFLVLAMTTLTVLSSSHSPTLFFWVRRYVPLVIPGLILLAAFGLTTLRPRFRYPLFALSLLFNVFTTRAVTHGYVEKGGTYPHLEMLSRHIEPGALQVCLNGDYCNKVAVPLHSHFDIDTFYLTPGLNRQKVKFLKMALKSGRDVYVTFSNLGGVTFTADELALLKRARIQVELAAEAVHISPMLVGLEDEWEPTKAWSNLYFPRVLFGERRLAGRKFPAIILRLRLKQRL